MILTVPNWSFGRSPNLLRQCRALVESQPVCLHFCESDLDHNRTVIAFSAGDWGAIESTLDSLNALILDSIDLNRHSGVHPRIGALDVCPFIPVGEAPTLDLLADVEKYASNFAARFGIPVFLYEKSERGRHESDLPALRKGGFGGLLLRGELQPDFGPKAAHPQWGASVMGVRDFLIALNANFHSGDLETARLIAGAIRRLRQDGDPRFLGVRALGLPLASQDVVQVSMNITLPDLTPIDLIAQYVLDAGAGEGLGRAKMELIGVIRSTDAPQATLIPYRPEQVVAWV